VQSSVRPDAGGAVLAVRSRRRSLQCDCRCYQL